LAVGAAALVALGLGGLGLYLGLSEEKAAKKPSFSVKYALSSNTTSSSAISLATTEDQCTYRFSSFSDSPVPMPHQVILCIDENYCNSEYMIVSLYDYQTYL
jgi:hypothetical protein